MEKQRVSSSAGCIQKTNIFPWGHGAEKPVSNVQSGSGSNIECAPFVFRTQISMSLWSCTGPYTHTSLLTPGSGEFIMEKKKGPEIPRHVSNFQQVDPLGEFGNASVSTNPRKGFSSFVSFLLSGSCRQAFSNLVLFCALITSYYLLLLTSWKIALLQV